MYVGLVDKAMLTQTCTRRVHSSSEESAALSSAPWSRLIGCSLLLFLWRRRVVIETLTPHAYIFIPLTRNRSTAASLHHRAFDLRNPAPPPFSLFEPPKTLPKLVS